MLRNCVIFSLFIAAIHATGEFTVLNSPKSISFKGNDALESHEIDEVLLAAMGNPITGNSKFGGVVIQDPFNMAKGIIAVHVQGVNHVAAAGNAKTFDLVGSSTTSSLNTLAAELEANNEPVCDLKFDQDADQTFKSYFGDVAIVPAKPTKHLNPSLHNADKQFLEFIGLITGAAENLADMSKPCNVLIMRMGLDGIAKAHGEKSEALEEAQKILSAAINRLLAAAQKSMDSVLVVQIAEKESINARSKRDALPGSKDNSFNLATYYNADYPVIFNIILWFMVVFGFSLLAICYAIGSMDPGRDSIIYRMTSTRMKKDN